MSKSRVAGIVVLVAGGALLAVGLGVYRRESGGSLGAKVAAAMALRDSTRAELRETSLRYQGLLKSGAAIPDSIRQHDAGVIWRQSQDYEKKIYVLEMKERDQTLHVNKLEKQQAAARRRQLAESVPFAGVGAVASLVGAILLARPRSRSVAA